MTDIPIKFTSTVICPMLGANVLLSMCRICKYHRHETVDGFVVCSWIMKKDDKRFPKDEQ